MLKLPLSEDKTMRAEELKLFNEYLRITYGKKDKKSLNKK